MFVRSQAAAQKSTSIPSKAISVAGKILQAVSRLTAYLKLEIASTSRLGHVLTTLACYTEAKLELSVRQGAAGAPRGKEGGTHGSQSEFCQSGVDEWC
jgi:hypothetical protein